MRKDFLKTTILHSLPQKFVLINVRGHEIYNFLSPYPIEDTYKIW